MCTRELPSGIHRTLSYSRSEFVLVHSLLVFSCEFGPQLIGVSQPVGPRHDELQRLGPPGQVTVASSSSSM